MIRPVILPPNTLDYYAMKGRIVSCYTAASFHALQPAIRDFPPQDANDLLLTWARARWERLGPEPRDAA